MSVMGFIGLAIGLLLLTLWFLLRPLWRATEANADRTALNKNLYRERAAEIEQLFAAGSIDADEKARRDAENARRLLADTDAVERRGVTEPLRKPLLLVLAVALPLVAGLLYGKLGHYPQVQAWQSLDASALSKGDSNMSDMLLLLRSRLHDDPEDLDGWYLLGRTYLSLQRPHEALQAFMHARKLAPQEPDYLVAYAQTLRMAEQDAALPEVDRLLQQALQLDPSHEGARLLTAYRDMELGRFEQAIATFSQLKDNRAQDSESAAMLDKVIADARAAQAKAGQDQNARAAAAAPVNPAKPGNQTEPSNQPTTGGGSATSASLSVKVSLAPGLQGRLTEKARVFVFARSEQGPGLPVAVAVLPATALPATVSLSDANAMNPAVKLSDQQRVTLIARISMAGTVEPTAGDLQGKLAAFDWRVQPQQSLQIDTVL